MFLPSFQREPHTSTNVSVSWRTPWSTKIDFNCKAKSTWIFTYNLLSERFSPQAHMWFQVFIKHHKYIRLVHELRDRRAHAGRSRILRKPPVFSSSAWWVTHMVPVSSTHLREIKILPQLSSASLQWPSPLISKISSDYSLNPIIANPTQSHP